MDETPRVGGILGDGLGREFVTSDPRLCPCRSGLRHARCCGLPPQALGAAAEAGVGLGAAVQRAAAAWRRGAAAEAERLCLEILEQAAAQREALALLARISLAARKGSAAEALLRRLTRLNPLDLWAAFELAQLLIDKRDLAGAEFYARAVIRLAPTDPAAHRLMGMLLTLANRHGFAEHHHRRVIALSAERAAEILGLLAWNLTNQGRIVEARALYVESLAAAPGQVRVLLCAAINDEADRQFDAALGLLDRAIALAPDDRRVLAERAAVLARQRAHAPALALFDRLARLPPAMALTPDEGLQKGRLLDGMGRYDEAFACFAAARRREGARYQAEAASKLAARLTDFFTAERLALFEPARARADRAGPIFILGFPRSGTTLVEQILSAHPAIAAGDELPGIGDLTRVLPSLLQSPIGYPEALLELCMAEQRRGLDRLRDYYFDSVEALNVCPPGVAWFTDKMPLNETHLGLIHLIFPQAPLIHVIRHPLDVALSVYSNRMSHGFDCGASLEGVARHYALIMDLVEHYLSQTRPRYLRIRYEDIVDDQEASLRRMLDFIGLPFDPACLNFHENRRYARTASYGQVTEKLYTTARYRHRRYARHLTGIMPILAPVIARLGYGD